MHRKKSLIRVFPVCFSDKHFVSSGPENPHFISEQKECLKYQNNYHIYPSKVTKNQGFFQQFWKKAPGQNWEKMIDLTSKLGEINDIEHYKGSKIYLQNQVILEYIMPTLLLKHKCLSIILIWVIVYHK